MNEAFQLEQYLDNVKLLYIKDDDYIKGLRLLVIGNKEQIEKAYKFLTLIPEWQQTIKDEALMIETYIDINNMIPVKKWDYRKC